MSMNAEALAMELDRDRRGEEMRAKPHEVALALEIHGMQLHLRDCMEKKDGDPVHAMRGETMQSIMRVTPQEAASASKLKSENLVDALRKVHEGKDVRDLKEIAHALMVKAFQLRMLDKKKEEKDERQTMQEDEKVPRTVDAPQINDDPATGDSPEQPEPVRQKHPSGLPANAEPVLAA
jgi:hypothetical protein